MNAPSGSEAPPENNDPFREARAYHMSVYLMVGMPYLLLGVVGFLVYRAVKLHERKDAIPTDTSSSDLGGSSSCPSPEETSPPRP